jgi:hypothetical protein
VKVRSLLPLMGACLTLIWTACGQGGSGSGASSNNTQPTPAVARNAMALVVNSGPVPSVRSADRAFTSVTICPPGSGNCQTIPGILVDSGSFGLRLFAQTVSVSLPSITDGGIPIGECAPFASAVVAWGPMVSANVILGGEPGVTVPIQIMADSSFAQAPSSCSSLGVVWSGPADPSAGVNGVLGVGVFPTDRGAGLYFACPANASCEQINETPSQDAADPIAFLPADNNGVQFQLPAVGANGAAVVSGQLLMGIGTRSNNGLGSAAVYSTDNVGNFSTIFNGQKLPASFVDSGSNGLFFEDAQIGTCPSDPGFFCPPSTLGLSAQPVGVNGQSSTVAFDIANAEHLFSTGNSAFNNLGGPFSAGQFDWGLPFFLGRNVFVGFAGASTPGGSGPFYGF